MGMRRDLRQPALPGAEEWFRVADDAAVLVERSTKAQALPMVLTDSTVALAVAAALTGSERLLDDGDD